VPRSPRSSLPLVFSSQKYVFPSLVVLYMYIRNRKVPAVVPFQFIHKAQLCIISGTCYVLHSSAVTRLAHMWQDLEKNICGKCSECYEC
jgi:hypothetical protein